MNKDIGLDHKLVGVFFDYFDLTMVKNLFSTTLYDEVNHPDYFTAQINKTARVVQYKKPFRIIQVITTEEDAKNKGVLYHETDGLAWKFNIGVAGAQCSGKTTLAQSFCSMVKSRYALNCVYIPEYASTAILQNGGIKDIAHQLVIMHRQMEIEKIHEQKLNGVKITDSPTFLSYHYALEYTNDNFIRTYMYEKVVQDLQRYTHIVLLKPREFVNDGVRIYPPEKSEQFYFNLKSFLTTHNVPFIDGPINEQQLFDKCFKINRIS